MKVVVTGGAGFIGSCLVRTLVQKKDWQVLNIDKLTYAGNLESLSSVMGSASHELIQVDICNSHDLESEILKFQPDRIIHLAAESHVDNSIDSPSVFLETNIIGTFNVLAAARKLFTGYSDAKKSGFKLLHVSTDEVFGSLGREDSPFSESSPYDPSSPYSASKASADHIVRAWGKTYRLPIIITNCSNNYGPYQYPEKLIPHMILSAISGKPLPVYGDGQQIRDWLHVQDHVDALMTVLEHGQLNETYLIGGNYEKANLEVVKSICGYLKSNGYKMPNGSDDFHSLISFVTDRPAHDSRYAINADKLKHELGWEPKMTFEKGLNETIEWYLGNRRWWENIILKKYNLERVGVEAKYV